jgi:hypothetical protein
MMHWRAGSQVLLVALLVSLINLLPFWFARPGADVLFHYALIECFSSEFWQGNWYPRWCGSANSGLGSPVFLFYFPLPYYITALFYPLRHIGIMVEGQYILSVTSATLLTFFTCWRWLRDIVTPGRALLCAALFLFMPYRMEVMYFRTALAELWCMAFLPLLFMNVRKVAFGSYRSWLPLSLAMIAAVLCHVAVTFIALMGCTIQLITVARCHIRAWLAVAASGIVALGAVALYILPAIYYTQYLHEDALSFMRAVWVNQYLSLSTGLSRVSVMAGLLVTILFVIGLGVLVWRGRGRINEPRIVSEMKAWLISSVVAVLLLLPVSAPVWEVFYHLTGIMTPWRAQVLLPFAIIYFLALKMQWMMSEKQMHTWRCDYGALGALLLLLSLTMLTVRPPDVASLYQTVMESQVINAGEYQSRWTAKENADRERIIARFAHGSASQQAHITKGEGTLAVEQWNSQHITFTSDMKTDGQAVLEQFYFPIWRVVINGKDMGKLTPQENTGYMLLWLPAGTHRISMVTDLAYNMGLPYIAAGFVSLLSWTGLVFFILFYRRRHAGP